MQTKRILIATMMLIAAILACSTPFATPAQPPNVETVVASTFQALTETVPQASVTPPPSTSSVLPSSLYFLNNDSAGLLQVYRLEKDGKTVKQITFEPAKVDSFDPSRVDGSVVYVSNNQLLLVNADGSNRRVLLDGGPKDENNPFLNIQLAVTNPANPTEAITRVSRRICSNSSSFMMLLAAAVPAAQCESRFLLAESARRSARDAFV